MEARVARLLPGEPYPRDPSNCTSGCIPPASVLTSSILGVGRGLNLVYFRWWPPLLSLNSIIKK